MSLDLLHRRLVVAMGLVALTAFAGGAGFEPLSTLLAALALALALVWQPGSGASLRLERFCYSSCAQKPSDRSRSPTTPVCTTSPSH